MKKLLFAYLLFHSFFLGAQTIPVAEARMQAIGSTVTVRGVVTNGPELGKIRYLQDLTAGIAAYPGTGSAPNFEASVQLGDSLEVTGVLYDYQGLLEISPITSFQIISSGNTLPAPVIADLNGLDESLESRLVELSCVTFSGTGTFGTGSTAFADQNGQGGSIYLRAESPLIGTTIPSTPLAIVGILSQYTDYQLLPRSAADFLNNVCFYFLTPPLVSNQSQSGFTLNWTTNLASSCILSYGTSPALGTNLPLAGNTLQHSATLDNLLPGTIYWVQVTATHNGETILSEIQPFATVSNSSGLIKVYFNHDIDTTLTGNLQASGQSFDECMDAIVARIGAAQNSIDVTMYNNNRTDLTTALKTAAANGVVVRYIASEDTGNTALSPAPNFPVLYGNDTGLMHNKFLVIDADDTENAWVITGSMNWTTANMTNDFNNMIMLQDQSLARGYTIEFNEMWGGDGPQPDLGNSRFGGLKRNNTPHQYLVGGVPISSWFSPSDNTTFHIVENIRTTNERFSFACFSFTHNDIGEAIANVYQQGATTRGIIENISDQGCEYAFLQNQGVPVWNHPGNGLLHHKYGVVDAGFPLSDPLVITGSHNWTYSAESINDENTLIIHDADIALLFQAEFNKRLEVLAPLSVSMENSNNWSVYPNPASETLHITGADNNNSIIQISVYSATGQLVVQQSQLSANQLDIPLSTHLRPGFYFVKILDKHAVSTLSFQKI